MLKNWGGTWTITVPSKQFKLLGSGQEMDFSRNLTNVKSARAPNQQQVKAKLQKAFWHFSSSKSLVECKKFGPILKIMGYGDTHFEIKWDILLQKLWNVKKKKFIRTERSVSKFWHYWLICFLACNLRQAALFNVNKVFFDSSGTMKGSMSVAWVEI